METMLPALDQDEACHSAMLIGHNEPIDKRIDDKSQLWAMHFDRACDVEQDRSAHAEQKIFPSTHNGMFSMQDASILMEFERCPQLASHPRLQQRALCCSFQIDTCGFSERLGADMSRGSHALA